MAPGNGTVYLMDQPRFRFKSGVLPQGVGFAGIGVEYLHKDPDYVSRVHEHGGQVHVWTVDSMADVDLCVELGVDAIISNRPGDVLAHLRFPR